MSWSIYLVESTVKVSKALAKKLYRASGSEYEGQFYNDFFSSPADVVDGDGCLSFNRDHSEHMDYLSSTPELVILLAQAKVEGRVLFLDPENNLYWGHSFDGKGNYAKLKGELIWKPVQ